MPGKNLARANKIAEETAFILDRLQLIAQQQSADETGIQTREDAKQAFDFLLFIKRGGTEKKFHLANPQAYDMLERSAFHEEERLARKIARARRRHNS